MEVEDEALNMRISPSSSWISRCSCVFVVLKAATSAALLDELECNDDGFLLRQSRPGPQTAMIGWVESIFYHRFRLPSCVHSVIYLSHCFGAKL